MNPAEEIDHLRRQIADLTDRVRLLEACSQRVYQQGEPMSRAPYVNPFPLSLKSDLGLLAKLQEVVK